MNVEATEITPLIVDGASLITATLNDDKIATSSDVMWTSSAPNVATVTPNGIVISKGTGTAIIACIGDDKTIKTCAISSTASIQYTNNGNANTTITGATTGFAYNNPVIPVGFSAVDTNNAKWYKDDNTKECEYNKGLVIMDNKGNQFVWVPVDGTNITYAKHFSSYADVAPPNSATDKTSTYGGFWIGRYEAGLDVDMGTSAQTSSTSNARNKANTDTGVCNPVIVECASPWNYILYNNCRTFANAMYSNVSGKRDGD